ncbi:MAG: hypothetical protein ACLQED_08065 [Desulfobaccales bacterium]
MSKTGSANGSFLGNFIYDQLLPGSLLNGRIMDYEVDENYSEQDRD